jgi:hypothetical protein
MTPNQIQDRARRITNTYGSNFVSDDELLGYLNDFVQEACHYARAYERTDVLTSVASQATYTLTQSIHEIKVVLYDGDKCRPVTFREAEAQNYVLQQSSVMGTPDLYYLWAQELVFVPVPASSDLEIKIYSYGAPAELTSASTIPIPETLQHYLVDPIVYRILQKEQNPNATNFYQIWQNNKEIIKREMVQKNRSDGYRVVQQEEALIYGPYGVQ